MEKKRRRKGFLTVIVSLSLVMMPQLLANAGAGNRVVDTSLYETELDSAEWYDGDDDIMVQSGTIIFQNDSSSATKLVSKNIISVHKQLNEMFSAEFTIHFTQLPDGERFVFAMGLQSLDAELSEQGNIELSFLNDNGVCKASLSAFTEDGAEENLMKSTSCGNGDVKIRVEVSTNQKMKLTIANKKVYEGSIPVTAEGSLGFLQTGSCGAEVKGLLVNTYTYDTPECPNFEEDFETGYYDANTLYSTMLSGATGNSTMHITDYNGSKVLMFHNTGVAYFGTKYAYSNFELTFDVPYMQQAPEYDENGNVVQVSSREFGLAFGSDGIYHTHEGGYTTATDLFCINSASGGYSLNRGGAITSGIETTEQNTPFSVKLSVVDGVVTLGMKLLGADTYNEAITYKLDATPTGNIIIWAPTGGATTFAIDNLKVVNKDVDGKVIDVEYCSSEIVVPEDFDYEPLGLNYRTDVANEDVQSDVWYRPLIFISGACVLALGITVILRISKAKKRKAGAIDEE